MEYNNYFDIQPYSLDKIRKSKFLENYFFELTKFHYENCPKYKSILDALKYKHNHQQNYSEIPFLPVRLFKMFDLYSIPKEKIVKTMTSSGTSGQNVSRILVAAKTELRPNDIVYVADRPIISFSRALSEINPLRILLRDIQEGNIP